MAFDSAAYQRRWRASERGKELSRLSTKRYMASPKRQAYLRAYTETGKRAVCARKYAVSYRGALRSALRRVAERHRERWPNEPLALKHADIIDLWRRQEGRCSLSGIAMTWGQGAVKATSLSIDRMDSERGYHLDNIRLICHAINAFRGNGTDAEMLEMATALVAFAKEGSRP